MSRRVSPLQVGDVVSVSVCPDRGAQVLSVAVNGECRASLRTSLPARNDARLFLTVDPGFRAQAYTLSLIHI